jgi:DNA repair protein RadC
VPHGNSLAAYPTLLLNRKNRITHEAMIYRGTVDAIQVRTAELFKEAVRVNAPVLLLSHCHPSGEPTPSPEDIHLTQVAHQAARLLDIELLDHIVVGRDLWVSMKEQGLGFVSATGKDTGAPATLPSPHPSVGR